jgi:hypothetical protein
VRDQPPLRRSIAMQLLEGIVMVKPNYSFAKRQRDLLKKQRKEEKRQRKAATPPATPSEEPDRPPVDPPTAA